ncbi:MAG: polysaccharide deacetylase family protein [Minicystis sp.]
MTCSRLARALRLSVLALAASACTPAATTPRASAVTPPIAARVADVPPAPEPTTEADATLTALLPAPAPEAALADSTDPAPTTPAPAPAVSLASAPTFEAAPRAQVRAVVLVYHLFGGMDTEMAVEPAAFEQQLGWLVEHHVPVITTSDLVDFLEGNRELPERAAVIQIDDGHVSVHGKAYPILRKHGLKFTLALNTEAIEGHRPEAVTWDAVREMLSSGLCEIASHSHIHGHMDRLTDARNQSEASLSRSILAERTGVRPTAFVYPFGANDERVRRTIEDAGYRAAFGVGGGAARAGSARFKVPRVGVTRSTNLAAFARLFGETGAEARAAAPKAGGRG